MSNASSEKLLTRKNPGAVFRCFAQQFLTACSVVRRFSISFHGHLFEHPPGLVSNELQSLFHGILKID